MTDESVLQDGKRVIRAAREALETLEGRLGNEFVQAVNLIHERKGRVIVTGVGKSGVIARKLAATLASTGTPSNYLHAAEGIHGDLGMITGDECIVALSHSGETEELLKLLPAFQRLGNPLIAITGRPDSTLANHASIVLDTSVTEQACPMGLAPTTSTTVMLTMGDALAIALLEKRGFREEDYAFLHPGGSLGNKLLLMVSDLMHTGKAIPVIEENTLMREALFEITSKGLGVTGVVDSESNLVGVITDGDLRRGLEQNSRMLEQPAFTIMTRDPKWISRNSLAQKALHMMEQFSITQLFVFEEAQHGPPIGIIHIHDILKAGIA